MKSKFDFSDDSFEMVNNHKNRKSKRFEIFNLKKVFSLSGEVDYASTLDAIKEDISFKGTTSWVLICSIFIASIGLNTNSTAVVIGAMLIAPLMGPVLGIGVSLAINDLNLLRNAFFNFLVMVFLSVSTASLFFLFFPLQQESSELLSRTSPDIRDVFIAFFGGAALAVAKTKKGTIASVIYGVAIATALMPPLCTIGYGISQLNLKYAVGAFYLFSINATYIAFASFVVIKILRFPMIKYVNSAKRRLTSYIVTILAVAVMVPAFYTFNSALEESRFKINANKFITEHVSVLKFGEYLVESSEINYYNSGEKRQIILNPHGILNINKEIIFDLQNKVSNYPELDGVEIIIK